MRSPSNFRRWSLIAAAAAVVILVVLVGIGWFIWLGGAKSLAGSGAAQAAPTGAAAGQVGNGPAGHIVFISDRDGQPAVYEIKVADALQAAGAAAPVRLTHNPGDDAWPSFSPDGKRIVYQSDVNDTAQIFVMDADGRNQKRLTDDGSENGFPTWSPDGSQIAFSSDRGGPSAIYVMNADGSHVTLLTDHPSNNWFPVWAPDGSALAFLSDRDGSHGNIFLMDPRGGGLKQLTTSPVLVAKPTWSPDSTRLAMFTGGGFLTVARDGSDPKPVTGDGEDPAWSPDGKWIAFASRRGGSHLQIYVTPPDGSTVMRLTSSSGEDSEPAWGR